MTVALAQHKLNRELAALFLLSGVSGLTYQVAWQRKLFAVIGVDVVSVAVIVSTFMLGLGLGGLIGGRIADRGHHLVKWFCGIEIAIGCFGALSMIVIEWLASHITSGTFVASALVAGLTLLIPTALMGATLPVLVVHIDQTIGNIGRSTGALYFCNTLGASLGALMTGFLLFNFLTLSQVVLVAALVNFSVAALAFRLDSRS